MTKARDVIAEALRLEHNEWDRPQPWHYANADRVLSALLSAPDAGRLELAAMLCPALIEALDEMIQLAEDGSHYKGEYLAKKHGDAEAIAKARTYLPAPPKEDK